MNGISMISFPNLSPKFCRIVRKRTQDSRNERKGHTTLAGRNFSVPERCARNNNINNRSSRTPFGSSNPRNTTQAESTTILSTNLLSLSSLQSINHGKYTGEGKTPKGGPPRKQADDQSGRSGVGSRKARPRTRRKETHYGNQKGCQGGADGCRQNHGQGE